LMTVLRSALAVTVLLGAPLVGVARQSSEPRDEKRMPEIQFMTLAPGHFHAALVQKEMYPGVSPRVDVYAPLGGDLLAHLGRVVAFNQRAARPTSWQLEVHTGPDFLDRMLSERPGTVVVLSGRNRGKIEYIGRSVDAGLHVLADKPWILRTSDLPRLEAVLGVADRKDLVAYDIMTERYEITSMLQRDLVNDRAVFGTIVNGTPEQPAVYMESVHHLMKTVAGAPNIRPAWFFDTTEQGEGLNDIGTHLVDLAQWTVFPDQGLDYRKDVRVVSAQRWPTMIPESDFRRVTGSAGFPEALKAQIKQGALEYFCNTLVTYSLRNIHVTLNVIWDWEAPSGSGDTHYAVYKGTRSRIEVRQGKAEQFRPELYVVPGDGESRDRLLHAIRARIDSLRSSYPGVQVVEHGQEFRVTIPDALRVGHEEHFAQVTDRFLRYVRNRRDLPEWERPNMLAKYYVTTTGAELSRQGAPRPAPRLAPK
jgi:predicted dehydrogenase